MREALNNDRDGILTAHYIRTLIKFDMEYTNMLQILLDNLQSTTKPLDIKVKIAETIFSTPDYEQYYSSKILNSALNCIKTSIPNIHSYELLFIIRLIYNYRDPSTKAFG